MEAFTRGDTDLASARTRLKDFLQRKGLQPDDVVSGDGDDLGNLASTRRLNLILEQNAAMAHALGARQVSMDPDVLERWPYFRYDARSDARAGHAALDGLVLPKTDAFWATHTPPWEFNCRCAIFDADEDDAAAYGLGNAVTREQPDGSQTATLTTGSGAIVNVPANKSGFVFRVDAGSAGGSPALNWDAVSGPLKTPLTAAARDDASLTITQRLRIAEDEIVELRHERALVYDSGGNLLYKNDGGRNAVTVPQQYLKDAHVTHNHPAGWDFPETDPQRGGNSFSSADVNLAVRGDAAELRAVSPGYRHVLRRPDGGWPPVDRVLDTRRAQHRQVQVEFYAEISAGRMTAEAANAVHAHTVMQRTADKLGIFYEREAR